MFHVLGDNLSVARFIFPGQGCAEIDRLIHLSHVKFRFSPFGQRYLVGAVRKRRLAATSCLYGFSRVGRGRFGRSTVGGSGCSDLNQTTLV